MLEFLADLNILSLALITIMLVVFVFFVMVIISLITNTSVYENFDKYINAYIGAFCTSIIPITLLLYKINLILAIGFLAWFFLYIRRVADDVRYRNDDDGISLLAQLYSNRSERIKRRIALKKAADFLRPYNNIMGQHILSNKYCQINYYPKFKDVSKFTCMSKTKNKNGEYSYFEACTNESRKWHDDFFDSLCFNFSYDTKLDNVYIILEKYDFIFFNSNYVVSKANIEKDNNSNSVLDSSNREELTQEQVVEKIKIKEEQILKNMAQEIKDASIEKIDINLASEAEITALPAINIVQAKKIIKHRTMYGDFKTFDEFISYLKIKPHFVESLKKRVLVEQHTLRLDIKNLVSKERVVDID